MADSKLRLAQPRLTNHPVDVGLRSEAAIFLELLRRGYAFSLPFGVNQRYDVIIDLDGELIKAQCKTGRLRNGSVEFNTHSVQCNMNRTSFRGYRGDADVFLVYCRETDGVYVIPVEEAPERHASLRVAPARNGQRSRVRWAAEYELPG